MEPTLNKQQEQFVERYFQLGLNATKAYQEAYNCDYESANASASRLLVNVSVQTAIEKKYSELQQRNSIKIDEIIFELKNLIEETKEDGDRKNLLRSLDQLSKIIGAYAPIKTEQLNQVPIQVNIIAPK